MLGKLLLRSVTNDLAGSMLGGLGRAAAFGAGAVLVSELVNSATGRQVIPAGNYVPQQISRTLPVTHLIRARRSQMSPLPESRFAITSPKPTASSLPRNRWIWTICARA